jgi:predicted DNA-binding transcriptional regulator YafY
MRADRLLSILLLLQVQRRTTTHELAARLEVSERTILRDMQALGMAGVPLISERGCMGGWSLLEEYRTNLTGLNISEVQALFLSRPASIMSDLGLQNASEGALIKLLAALPSLTRSAAEYTRKYIYLDTPGWRQQNDSTPYLSTLHSAIWQKRVVRFLYERFATQSERIVSPLGLVAKGNVWYLVAWIEEQLRSYRVSRIREAEILEQRAYYPPNFDLATYWQQSSREFKANLPHYEAEVRTTSIVLDYIQSGYRSIHIEPVDTTDEKGWHHIMLHFETEYEAATFLAGFGEQVEILSPMALRDKVIEIARKMIAFYRLHDDTTPT